MDDLDIVVAQIKLLETSNNKILLQATTNLWIVNPAHTVVEEEEVLDLITKHCKEILSRFYSRPC